MKALSSIIPAALLGALFVLILALATSACKRRDTVAEPLLPFGKKPAESGEAKPEAEEADKAAPSATVEGDGKAPKPAAEAPRPGTATAPPAGARPRPEDGPWPADAPEREGIDFARAKESAGQLRGRLIYDGSEGGFACVRLGGRAVAPSRFERGLPLREDGQQTALGLAGLIPDTDLAVWESLPPPAKAGAPLRRKPLELGEELVAVAFADGRVIALSTRVAALPEAPDQTAPLSGVARLLLLDRALEPGLSAAVLIDGGYRIAGLLTGRRLHGLSLALSADELRLLASPGTNLTALYGPKPPGETLPPTDEGQTKAGGEEPPAKALYASERLWLGVEVKGLRPELAGRFGLMGVETGIMVTKVYPNSPAHRAGLAEGDILVGLSGRAVNKLSDLPPIMAGAEAGRELPVELLRRNKRLTLAVPPEDRPGGNQ